MDGILRIRVAAEGGETRVTDSYARAPFHYLPPSRRKGDLPRLTIVNSSGGVLGGDRLEVEVEVGAGAALSLRTQAATKIYRSERGPARSDCRFRLAEGAFLDYFPDEIIPFAGSDYAQTSEIDLAPGASMLLAEVVCAGRIARGERFAFNRLVLDLTCSAAGSCRRLRDRADLRPREGRWESEAILGEASIWGSFYLLRAEPLDASLIDAVDERLRSVEDGAGGATAGPAGLFGRVLGSSLDSVRETLGRARDAALNHRRRGEGG